MKIRAMTYLSYSGAIGAKRREPVPRDRYRTITGCLRGRVEQSLASRNRCRAGAVFAVSRLLAPQGFIEVPIHFRDRSGGQQVGIIGHDVGAEPAGRGLVCFVDAAQHDSTTWWPVKLRVVDMVAVADHEHFFETKGLDEKPDQGPCIDRSQGRPDLGSRNTLVHRPEASNGRRGALPRSLDHQS